MREIKFKAWDKRNNKIINWNKLNQLMDWAGPGVCLSDWFNNSKLQIMQFTGLKDKNGNEIYDGDIVRFTRTVNYGWNIEKDSISVVQYYCDRGGRYCGFGFGKNIPLTYKRSKQLIIIGNIYENPNLLYNNK